MTSVVIQILLFLRREHFIIVVNGFQNTYNGPLSACAYLGVYFINRKFQFCLRNYNTFVSISLKNKLVVPLGKATEVAIKLYVRSLGSINPDTMDYQVDLYLRQHWFDSRLNHPGLLEPMDLNDPNLVKALWKPEVYFPNAKDAEFQYVTVPNVLVRIDPGGAILYMLRLKLKFSCMMELSKFPLDEQYCTMEIASFSKTTKELIPSMERY
ncbi:Glycine receptor subunit alpha-2 [Lepeophtheirus salmonis]|uniref:Glycine receptor subunit alpha-2 n=1 Tax=Lepeophtheirus salmonis TaxID=72036 RepID=A0A7R8D1F6_LEPSM|nr:Glycine receptor subunit alpha-2 [Lepeophtheirus salmonis]CAF2995208.1 Glycine receptor subunit alpha-2 [Lepeophtheirus salmonis]